MRANSPPYTNPSLEPPRPTTTRRKFIYGVAAITGGLALWSNEVSRHEIELTHRTFHIRNLPPGFDGYRIVQISDIHLDEYTEDFFLKEVIARVNALTPDLVLITGDYCSRGPLPERYALAGARRCAELLPAIACPRRFCILGNHDAFVAPIMIRRDLERHGLPVLVNQYVPLEHNGARIWLGGLDDIIGGHPQLELAVPTDRILDNAPILLMAHEPDYIDTIAAHPRGSRVDLVFSGHTHGGQVRLPGGRPLLLPPEGKNYPEGHYALGNIQLYVNRGLGTVGLPFRLNCPPEITLATLKAAQPAA